MGIEITVGAEKITEKNDPVDFFKLFMIILEGRHANKIILRNLASGGYFVSASPYAISTPISYSDYCELIGGAAALVLAGNDIITGPFKDVINRGKEMGFIKNYD